MIEDVKNDCDEVFGKDRPLITFALFAFNQANYIQAAVLGALSQTYSPLEIILSDDCSTDQTYEIMCELTKNYNGPHNVILNRNPSNLNIGSHVNTIGHLASGEFIVMAAGDDLSMSHRTERLARRWLSLGKPTAVLFSDFEPVDSMSKSVELRGESIFRGDYRISDLAAGAGYVLGATAAVTRDVFTSFQPMDSDVRHEDRVLPYRAMLLGGILVLVDEKLVRYRVEGGISRVLPESAREFLYEYTPAHAARILPDAIQRYADTEHICPGNRDLKKLCIATIADNEARKEVISSKSFFPEYWFLKWLLRGSRPKPLFKLYLKLRFIGLFDHYFRSSKDLV